MGDTTEETVQEVMVVDATPATTPFEQLTRSFVFDQVWTRPGLSRRDRRLVTLACVCASDATGPIDDHIYAALASGDLTLEEMTEFTLQFAVYCGWPKASQVETAMRVQWARMHTERGEAVPPWPQLHTDTLGPPDPEERLLGGEREFLEVNFWPAPPRDSPYFHAGILNFVFGHVWQRPAMGRRDRRLITLACVGVCDSMGPIRSHIGSAMRSGDVTFEEMGEVILQFSAYYGFAKGEVMNEVAAEEWARIRAERAESTPDATPGAELRPGRPTGGDSE